MTLIDSAVTVLGRLVTLRPVSRKDTIRRAKMRRSRFTGKQTLGSLLPYVMATVAAVAVLAGTACASGGRAAPTGDTRVVDNNGIWHLALPKKPISQTEAPSIWVMPDELNERTLINVLISGEVEKLVNFSIPTGGAAQWNKISPLSPLPSGNYTVQVITQNGGEAVLNGVLEVGP